MSACFASKQAGLNYVGLAVPVGRMTSEQMLQVADLAENYGSGQLRLTVGQNVIIPNVPDAKIGALTDEPVLRELRYDPSEVMRGLVSCTGMDYCHFALIDTKGWALKTARVAGRQNSVRPSRCACIGRAVRRAVAITPSPTSVCSARISNSTAKWSKRSMFSPAARRVAKPNFPSEDHGRCSLRRSAGGGRRLGQTWRFQGDAPAAAKNSPSGGAWHKAGS